MNIVVLLKQVHDPNLPRSALRIGEDGKTLNFAVGANPILNGYDANALEEALRLRERCGGAVTALGLGSEQSKDVLRRALAIGADKAVLVAGDAGIAGDAFVTAHLLWAAIRSMGTARLILAGRSASDTDSGTVGPLIAGFLGMPVVTPVRAITYENDGSVVVQKITDLGYRQLRVTGPVVLGISNEANKPRTPQLKGVAAAKRATIDTLTPADLGVSMIPAAMRIRRLYIPVEKTTVTEMVTASTPAAAGRLLADRLYAEGLI